MLAANVIKADRFMTALETALQPARGTYIFDAVIRDAQEKTGQADSSGYIKWLRRLLAHLTQQPGVSGVRTLDIGCGTGELTVLMKLLGVDAVGLDVHEQNIQLARVLAQENGLPPEMFIRHDGNRLPFPDRAFDIVTMISVLEHVDDPTLSQLVPELARVCAGVLFVQAPSSASFRDDHTGLLFLPSLPNRLARAYVAVLGKRYQYKISASGSWDVNYRSFEQAIRCFEPYFDYEFSPNSCCYPEVPEEFSPTWIGKRFHLFEREIFLGLPLPWRQFRISRGYPKEAYYPYLNLTFRHKANHSEN